MAERKKSIAKLIAFTAFVFFLFPISNSAQSFIINGTEIPEASFKNYRIGLRSDNQGVIMSCLYFAGKYKIKEFSEDIVELVNCSQENVDLCKMAIWSLYQIGDLQCCKKVNNILESHTSTDLRNCCRFLKMIKDYDTEIIKTLRMASK